MKGAQNKGGFRGGLLAKAELSLQLGEPAAAQSLALETLKQDPEHVGALEVLAKAQWQLDDPGKLLETLTTLIRLNPYEPGYHMLKGTALRNLGRYGEAARAFVRAGGDAGNSGALAEVSEVQAQLVKQLLDEDPVFRAEYRQNAEKACAARGFEFRSETKIRNQVLLSHFTETRPFVRPS